MSTTPLTAAEIAALREKLEKATPGPWFARGRFLSRVPDSTGMGGTLETNHVGICDPADTASIAEQTRLTRRSDDLARCRARSYDRRSSPRSSASRTWHCSGSCVTKLVRDRFVACGAPPAATPTKPRAATLGFVLLA